MPGKPRILIVDDERDICDLLKNKLESLGFEISLAYDGSEAFQKTVDARPDCVLLDVRMAPGEDGLTFLRKIRNYRDDDPERQAAIRKLPVIVLTAAGERMEPLFHQEGISGYIEKPFELNIVRAEILKALAS